MSKNENVNVNVNVGGEITPNTYIGAIDGVYLIDPNYCIGCSICAIFCPWNPGTCYQDPENPLLYVVNAETCTGCGVCAHECPVEEAIYPVRNGSM